MKPVDREWADTLRRAAHQAYERGGLGAYQEALRPLVERVRSLGLPPDEEEGEPVLCACGCGQATPIAARTDRRIGARRGKPMRYVNGHSGRWKREAPNRQPPTDKGRVEEALGC